MKKTKALIRMDELFYDGHGEAELGSTTYKIVNISDVEDMREGALYVNDEEVSDDYDEDDCDLSAEDGYHCTADHQVMKFITEEEAKVYQKIIDDYKGISMEPTPSNKTLTREEIKMSDIKGSHPYELREFKLLKIEQTDFDGEKGFCNYKCILQRESDSKFFKVIYTDYGRGQDNFKDQTAFEVIEKQKIVSYYE